MGDELRENFYCDVCGKRTTRVKGSKNLICFKCAKDFVNSKWGSNARK